MYPNEFTNHLNAVLPFIWFAATLVATFIVTKLFRVIWRLFNTATLHLLFLKNVLSVVIGVTGFFVALSWFPSFTTAATALFAGSGIVALVIGLALQEPLSNIFSGLILSVSKPFEVGDRVHLINAQITGTVEDITIRHTVIKSFLNSRIVVPNSVIKQELIENSHLTDRHASQFIDVIITHDSDVDAACKIIASVISEHPDFIDTRAEEDKKTTDLVPVFIRAITLHGVELRASMWTISVITNFVACSDARHDILKKFKEVGIEFARAPVVGLV